MIDKLKTRASARTSDTEADGRRTARSSSTRFKELDQERTGKEFPNNPLDQLRGAIGAVFGSWMNDRAIVYRRKYRHPARVGHGRQRAGDGLRQHGRRLRHRRGVHARSGDGREGFLRRISRSTPKAKTSSPACARPSRVQEMQTIRCWRRPSRSWKRCAGRLEKAFQGRAGFRVHDRGREAVHAPDAQRQAHRRRRRADRASRW